MTPTDIAVIAGGVVAIAGVNWYFFFAGKAASRVAVREVDTMEGR
jgi:glutamate synthase domain-containing protein 3